MPKTDRMYAGIVQGMLVSATGGEKFFRETVNGLAVNETDFRARLDSSVEADRMVAAGVVSLTALVRQWVLAHLLWNPDLDANALTDIFLAGYYGPRTGAAGAAGTPGAN